MADMETQIVVTVGQLHHLVELVSALDSETGAGQTDLTKKVEIADAIHNQIGDMLGEHVGLVYELAEVH